MAEHNSANETELVDAEEQQKTFEGFLKVCVLVAVITAAILIFLAFVGT